MACARPLDKGKANAEIIRGFRKLLGCRARILSGLSSRNKLVLLEGVSRERLNSAMDKNKT